MNKVGDCTQLKKTIYVVKYLAKTLISKSIYSEKFKNLGDSLEKKKLTVWKRAKGVGGCDEELGLLIWNIETLHRI
jgi:hypothetical protein